MKEDIEIQDLWTILRGECSLPHMMKLFGLTYEEIKTSMEHIKQSDKHDSSTFFDTANIYSNLAYRLLVKKGEIPADHIFNAATSRVENTGSIGDIGYTMEKTYRFNGNKWEEMK